MLVLTPNWPKSNPYIYASVFNQNFCFKRKKDGDAENLMLSTEFQSLLDEMSSSSEYDSEESDSYSLPDIDGDYFEEYSM